MKQSVKKKKKKQSEAKRMSGKSNTTKVNVHISSTAPFCRLKKCILNLAASDKGGLDQTFLKLCLYACFEGDCPQCVEFRNVISQFVVCIKKMEEIAQNDVGVCCGLVVK